MAEEDLIPAEEGGARKDVAESVDVIPDPKSGKKRTGFFAGLLHRREKAVGLSVPDVPEPSVDDAVVPADTDSRASPLPDAPVVPEDEEVPEPVSEPVTVEIRADVPEFLNLYGAGTPEPPVDSVVPADTDFHVSPPPPPADSSVPEDGVVPEPVSEPVTVETDAAVPDSPDSSVPSAPEPVVDSVVPADTDFHVFPPPAVSSVPEDEVVPEPVSEPEIVEMSADAGPSVDVIPDPTLKKKQTGLFGGLLHRGKSPSPEDPGTHLILEAPGVAVPVGAAPKPADVITDKKRKKKRIGVLAGLLHRGDNTSKPYDLEIHGPLVNAAVPDGYRLVERYWIVPGCSEVMIVENQVTRQNEYHLNEPELSEFEYEIVERLHADLRDVLILTDEEVLRERDFVLRSKSIGLLDDYGVTLTLASYYRIMYFINRNFLGWARLDPLMKDQKLEDISCDGIGVPVFLYHRVYRNVQTNVRFDEDSLNSLAIRLSQRSGKHVSISNPVLDATLPDGSRLQLTYGSEVTTRGTSFTIRKFREEPFSPVELILRGTFSAEALAYFWIGIENNKNLLFVGGTASGKTSSLNAVSLFLPPLSKVVSIEDTREITLYHDNWIASVTRDAIADTSSSKIDMFDLLKAAMRQRPEYIIVGEVRGNEAQTLFQAMNTGHTTFSTMHANDVDSAIHRLENQPLNVPRNMVQALNIVSIQALTYIGRERVRRATEIVEIAGIDPGTGNLRVNTVFEYNPVTDVFSFSGRSVVYAAIMEQRGWTYDTLTSEVGRRVAVLNGMKDQNITNYIEVSRILRAYGIDADSVMASIDDLKQAMI